MFEIWQQQAIRIGLIVLMLAAFVVSVTLFLAREIGRRARAEHSLEQLAIDRRADRAEEPAQIR